MEIAVCPLQRVCRCTFVFCSDGGAADGQAESVGRLGVDWPSVRSDRRPIGHSRSQSPAEGRRPMGTGQRVHRRRTRTRDADRESQIDRLQTLPAMGTR